MVGLFLFVAYWQNIEGNSITAQVEEGEALGHCMKCIESDPHGTPLPGQGPDAFDMYGSPNCAYSGTYWDDTESCTDDLFFDDPEYGELCENECPQPWWDHCWLYGKSEQPSGFGAEDSCVEVDRWVLARGNYWLEDDEAASLPFVCLAFFYESDCEDGDDFCDPLDWPYNDVYRTKRSCCCENPDSKGCESVDCGEPCPGGCGDGEECIDGECLRVCIESADCHDQNTCTDDICAEGYCEYRDTQRCDCMDNPNEWCKGKPTDTQELCGTTDCQTCVCTLGYCSNVINNNNPACAVEPSNGSSEGIYDPVKFPSSKSSIAVVSSQKSSVPVQEEKSSSSVFPVNHCGDKKVSSGEECEVGTECTKHSCNYLDCTCVKKPPLCGNGVVDAGEGCDVGVECLIGQTCDYRDCACVPIQSFCGDGKLDEGEQCEYGFSCLPGSNCLFSNCTCVEKKWFCGDGRLGRKEKCEMTYVCDEGKNCNYTKCSCTEEEAFCGNGTIDPGEQCEFGFACPIGSKCNLDSCRCGNEKEDPVPVKPVSSSPAKKAVSSATPPPPSQASSKAPTPPPPPPPEPSPSYVPETNIISSPQEPEGSSEPRTAASNEVAEEDIHESAPFCGDGTVDADEECDDGDSNSDIHSNTCRANCMFPVCGDFVVDWKNGEECDQGTGNSDEIPDRCRTDCTFPLCGDGIVDSIEGCDDGNITSGDGCSSGCIEEKLAAEEYESTEVALDIIKRKKKEKKEVSSKQASSKKRRSPSSSSEKSILKVQEVKSPPPIPKQPIPVQPVPVPAQPTRPPIMPQPTVPSPLMMQQLMNIPRAPTTQYSRYQLPVAQMLPIIQSQGPVGETGPAIALVIAAGAGAGLAWRKKKKKP